LNLLCAIVGFIWHIIMSIPSILINLIYDGLSVLIPGFIIYKIHTNILRKIKYKPFRITAIILITIIIFTITCVLMAFLTNFFHLDKYIYYDLEF
jgi:hypothetical protein